MSGDLRKSISRLTDIVAELQKGEVKADGRDGHATVGNPMKDSMPHQIAKPAGMPLAKSANSKIPTPKKGIPKPTHRVPVKHINPTKERAYLKVQKSIVLINREIDASSFRPMTDDMIMKSFGNMPDFMQNVNSRPSVSWWERGMERVGNYESKPADYLSNIWYGDINKEAPWSEERGQSNAQQELKGENKDDDLKRWIASALEGGGLGSLRNHPRAGDAIKKACSYVGKSILGKSNNLIKSGVGDIDPEVLGSAVIDAIDEIVNTSGDEKLAKAWSGTLGGIITKDAGSVIGTGVGGVMGGAAAGPIGAGVGALGGQKIGEQFDKKSIDVPAAVAAAGKGINEGSKEYRTLTQKSVAEPISSKFTPKARKGRLGEEYDGESAVSGDGTKLNVGDLTSKNETVKDI